jgi:hypothetical protein
VKIKLLAEGKKERKTLVIARDLQNELHPRAFIITSFPNSITSRTSDTFWVDTLEM